MASRTRKFFLNALALTATAFIMRGVSVIFNAYVSNAAGSEAMGLFSLITSVYVFSITVACASINLGTTRTVADALGLNDPQLAKRAARRALVIALVSSSIATIVLFFCSGFISSYILGDLRADRPLKILSLSLISLEEAPINISNSPLSTCHLFKGWL
jgi:stage V sporulation protein B